MIEKRAHKLKIVFLGTGTSQGIPVVSCKCDVCSSKDSKDKRLRSSLLISYKNTNIVIDTGPDFRTQMLRQKLNKLDAIILTHDHYDHIAGLDDVRAFNFIQKKTMPVYCNPNTFNSIKKYYYYAFDDYDYLGAPKLNLIKVGEAPFNIDELEIIPINYFHYRRLVMGIRVASVTYLTDISYIEDKEKEKIKGSKVLIISAPTKEPHYSHFNLEQALNFVSEFNASKVIITHIGHTIGRYKDVQKELPTNTFLSYDGMKIYI